MISRKVKLDKELFIGCTASFVLPFIFILIGYSLKEIAPFGERTLCSMDGFSQYYPMLENMSQAIKDGEVFYSFNGALGFNLWAQSAYYTNSPLWLLIYFLPHAGQLVAINLLVAARLSLASVFFYYRIYEKYPNAESTKKCILFPAVSLCYGLSGYMLAFINQFMWADVVMLLPLVVLGLEKLHKKGSCRLYILTLFLCMWSCFYLSYMVCIFMALYFIFLSLKSKDSFRVFMEKGLRFAFCSVIAAALAAVVLIPVYKALSLTLASELGFGGTLEFKYTLKEMLTQLLPYRKPSLEYDAPNLYFSLTAVLILVAALLSKALSLRKRILYGLFLIFMLLTMSLNLGEFIWHGFHYPNQLPGRQSFIFIFLALSLVSSFLAAVPVNKLLGSAISIVICVEMCLNVCNHMKNNVWAALSSSIRRYDYTMSEFTALDDNEDFMRIEWADVKKNNYPQQYSYKGVTYYSSTMSGDAYNFFQQLGIPRYARNVSVYYWQSDIANALFGIEYVMQDDGLTVYHNKNALPIAFVADESVLSFDLYAQAQGEETQKALWLSLTGESELNLSEQAKVLQNRGMEITDFDTDRIKGRISSDESGVLLFTIPFDGGWTLKVDGEKVPLTKVAGYLSGAEISAGTHEIEMVYTVPGIIPGAAVSAAVVVILAVIFLIRKKKHPIEGLI